MIDHILGRPSVKFRKYQVFTVLTIWSLYLYKGDQNGPPIIRNLSKSLSKRLSAWQILVITFLWLYIGRNFGKLIGLECPEPLANLYTRSYFRATWITTALDAGFWTAMKIKSKYLRDFSSMVFSIYYLFAAEQADEKVRKIRSSITLDHLRVSWNKPETPYLKVLNSLMRPRFMRYKPRQLRISRPKFSKYQDHINAWLYFDGSLKDLKSQTKLIIDIPGGGFIAMNPRIHDDKLMAWSYYTGLPILAIDYKKAPEFPYPYALNECYDTYQTIIESFGKCCGFQGNEIPKIILTGDSAGGNLVTGTVLMILQTNLTLELKWNELKPKNSLPLPESIILIYPSLDCNIGNWMSDDQMNLIKDVKHFKQNKLIMSRKSDDYKKLQPNTPYHSDDNEEEDEEDDDNDEEEDYDDQDKDNDKDEEDKAKGVGNQTDFRNDTNTSNKEKGSVITIINTIEDQRNSNDSKQVSKAKATNTKKMVKNQNNYMKTRLAMSSMISYVNDRILTPEMMRAMIILYIGPNNRPNFSTDYLLSPILAPDHLLSKFPKTYILTGERDPLVDDTVIFAGRLRQSHLQRYNDRFELGLIDKSNHFNEDDIVQVSLIPGISHGFLQFPGIFPEGWKYIKRCSEWISETFNSLDDDDSYQSNQINQSNQSNHFKKNRSVIWDGRKRSLSKKVNYDSSDGEDSKPLEMSRMKDKDKEKEKDKDEGKDDQIEYKDQLNGIENNQDDDEDDSQVEYRNKNHFKARTKSLSSLTSEDDLLSRRMKGLAGGLMGMENFDDKSS